MQPRVGIDLENSHKTIFTEIFAGSGGVDSYTNAISDTYHDNFGEGIYTGKGIYDLKVFNLVMKDKIPENTVLSHDLLEGNYLRCGLVSDIMLLDGYPKTYVSFLTRLHRWIRGDYQIVRYLGPKSGLNKLSRYKIVDNIRRSLLEITAILNIIVLSFFEMFSNAKFGFQIFVMLLSIVIPSILELLQYIIFRKENIKKQKTFTKTIEGLKGSLYRAVINLITLPTKAYISLDAMIRTIYRMTVSKEYLLEWTTSEEIEKKDRNSAVSVYKKMSANVILGLLILVLSLYANCSIYFKVFLYLTSVFYLIAPFIMWYISKEKTYQVAINKLTKEDKEYIINVAKKTWDYFFENASKENSYLPPDNYQESRREKLTPRTSSTNIGLGILSIISSYDLKFITLEEAVMHLENIINTVQSLEKWNGHLYNWYNIKTLEPLRPRYVSSVDSRKFYRIYVYFKDVFRGKRRYRI